LNRLFANRLPFDPASKANENKNGFNRLKPVSNGNG
jgi:hypothetical protein